mgnify:CR=1 FL=1
MPSPSSRFCQLVALWGLVLAVGCAPSDAPETASPDADSADLGSSESPFTSDGERVAATITSETLLEHVLALSGDDFEGRGPASAGDRKTQQYLSEQLKAAGFQPAAADGSWLQPFDIVGIDPAVPETWQFAAGDDAIELARWDDFVATSGAQVERAAVEDAEVVFVGNGIEAPEYGWNDFKGRDLSG